MAEQPNENKRSQIPTCSHCGRKIYDENGNTLKSFSFASPKDHRWEDFIICEDCMPEFMKLGKEEYCKSKFGDGNLEDPKNFEVLVKDICDFVHQEYRPKQL